MELLFVRPVAGEAGVRKDGPNVAIEVDAAARFGGRIVGGDRAERNQKREEGEVLIFVDSTAKEIPVKKGEIKQRFESAGSLMVSNFNELISPEDFNNLMAFLLTK